MAVLKLLSQDFTEEGWLKKSMSRSSISPTKALFVAHTYADEEKKIKPLFKVIVCVQIFPRAFCPSWDIVVTPLGGRGVWQLTVFLSIKNQNEKFHQEIHWESHSLEKEARAVQPKHHCFHRETWRWECYAVGMFPCLWNWNLVEVEEITMKEGYVKILKETWSRQKQNWVWVIASSSNTTTTQNIRRSWWTNTSWKLGSVSEDNQRSFRDSPKKNRLGMWDLLKTTINDCSNFDHCNVCFLWYFVSMCKVQLCEHP